MAFLNSLLFCICCFAEELIELEPTRAIPSTITCGGITKSTPNYETACNNLPGCAWVPAGVDSGETCVEDTCFASGEGTLTPKTGQKVACACNGPSQTMDQNGPSCSSWQTTGFPASSTTGAGKDLYCQAQVSAALDECSFQYLKNGSCVGPYCILIDYPAAPAGGKICQKIPECAVSKLTSGGIPNIIRLNDASIATCLTRRYQLGETTACNQNPQYYLNPGKTACVKDTYYGVAPGGDNPSCTSPSVLKQVQGVVANAVTTLSYCVHPDNPVLNTCWLLSNQTAPSSPPPNQCPLNPHANSTLLTENTGLCTGDCFTQVISSYYYGYTKICVNAESAGSSSRILVVPGLLAFLLLALFL